MAFRSHPNYYGHRQSAFSETIEGGESASSIIQKIHRGPQQGNEMEASPSPPRPPFYVSMEHFTVICPNSILLFLCIWRPAAAFSIWKAGVWR